MKWR